MGYNPAMPETQQINFRLSEETLAEIDALMEYCAISTRAEVVRQAVRLMSQLRLKATAEPPVKLKLPKRKAARAELGTVPGDRSRANVKRKGRG